MTALAGEVADGVSLHPFTTPRYVTTRTLPALRRGLDLTGRQPGEVALTGRVFVITGWTAAEKERAADWVRRRVSFYASTPAYRPVLEAHGWGELQDELNALSKQGRWEDMAARIDAEVLDAFAVTGEPDEIPGLVGTRWAGLLDEVTIAPPLDPTRSAAVVAAFQDATVKPVGSPAST
jgi:probable F420-dependent oxidoreductase